VHQLPDAIQEKQEHRNLLFVTLTEVVAAIQETVPTHDPFLLDEALETNPGSAVGVHHHLHQRGKEAAEVGSVLLWEGPQRQYKEAGECEVI